MDAGDKQCPSDVCLGLILFYIVIDNVEKGIKCTLSNFADNTKLSGTVDFIYPSELFILHCFTISSPTTELESETSSVFQPCIRTVSSLEILSHSFL